MNRTSLPSSRKRAQHNVETARRQEANAHVLAQLAELNELVNNYGADFSCAAAHMDLSVATIRRRWKLNQLCERAKLALRRGDLSVAQAEALAHADGFGQYAALDEIASRDGDCSAAAIRGILSEATAGYPSGPRSRS